MVLGPAWNCEAAANATVVCGPDVLAAAETAARQLNDDLARAEQLTDGWTNDAMALALVDAALSQCMWTLSATGCWGREALPASHRFWEIAGGWLARGSLQRHARLKPHGYAGDAELVARIWEFAECDDPLGRIFDRYFQRQAAACVVRARLEQAAFALADFRARRPRGDFHIASVGSSTAIEIETALKLLPAEALAGVRVTLLDLDATALETATGRLLSLLPAERIRPRRDNLFRLAQPGRWPELREGVDYAGCIGLMDYLTDQHAAEFIRVLFECLLPGGRLMIGNFAPHCATRAYMEWIGNWYLIYRTPSELVRLAQLAGLPEGSFRVGGERFGSDLFLVADRPA